MENSIHRTAIERNLVLDIGNPEAYERLAQVGKALSSPVRARILNLLRFQSMAVVEIAQKLSLPVSSTAFHLKCLEEAGLVITKTQPGQHGLMRVSLCCVNSVLICAESGNVSPEMRVITVDMPIGGFSDCRVLPTCGMADENGMLGIVDNPRAFYTPERLRAQLLWFQEGYVEYRFPNCYPCIEEDALQCLTFSFELCSEAPGYQESWPSDVDVSINGQACFRYRSPGDFGARRGKLTPFSWRMGSTQYGLLKKFSVRREGCFLDGAPQPHSPCLSDLRLNEGDCISLRIAIDSGAKCKGGINLFGEKYGDSPQNIVMQLDY